MPAPNKHDPDAAVPSNTLNVSTTIERTATALDILSLTLMVTSISNPPASNEEHETDASVKRLKKKSG